MSARGPVSKDRLFSPGAGSGNLSSRHPAESASYGAFAGMGFATSTPTQSRNAAYEHATTYRTLLYEVNSDTTKITPTWGKVSETPWFGEARRLQGFGRPVLVNQYYIIEESLSSIHLLFFCDYLLRALLHRRMLPCLYPSGRAGILRSSSSPRCPSIRRRSMCFQEDQRKR